MFVIGLLLATLLGAFGPADFAPSSTAPVYAADFPDPMVVHVGDAYYAYSTQTSWEKPGGVFPILRSTDLASWSYVGDVFHGSPRWGMDDWWAPDVVQRGSTFYLYYSGRNPAKVHCIAVATAASPVGPFTDRGVIGCGDPSGTGYIDPMAFVDSGGSWLYFSVDEPHHSISALPLSSDLLHADGPRIELFGVTQDWERGPEWTTVEGPYMVKHGSNYELFYSGNDWRNDYAEGVAIATSPVGPFSKPLDNPVLRGGAGLKGPGGGSLFSAGGATWMAYHAWSGQGRSLHLVRVCWSADAVRVGC